MEKNIKTFDKFICTVYIPLYILGLIVSVSFMLISINHFAKYMNILWIISMLLFVIAMIAVYFISKRIKLKKNKLNVHKVTVIKKLCFIVLSILIILINTAVLAILTVYSVIH